MPDSAMATWPPSSAMPQPMMVSTPNRRISVPVKNEGTNMPSTCHWITVAESPTSKPHISMASGVAVITMTITEKPTVEPISAVIYTGCLTIVHSGRAGPDIASTTAAATTGAITNKAAMPSSVRAR